MPEILKFVLIVLGVAIASGLLGFAAYKIGQIEQESFDKWHKELMDIGSKWERK